MKLNLCCGDKIIAGYENVDLSPTNGIEPDMYADIRRLPYLPDSAEEVLLIHAVEHFYRWEVDAVLEEIKRVLKPGGKLIVECPDLLNACREVLKAHENLDAEVDPAFTMWPLYGDPRMANELHTHKWGYSAGMLTALMMHVGFKNVQQEPAQFKKREPRDMRITGVK